MGDYKPIDDSKTGEGMVPQEAAILHDINTKICINQVTFSATFFASGWVFNKSFKFEHDDTWTGSYHKMAEREIPKGSNDISSHIVLRSKLMTMADLNLRGEFSCTETWIIKRKLKLLAVHLRI